jgi:hypothetical protein
LHVSAYLRRQAQLYQFHRFSRLSGGFGFTLSVIVHLADLICMQTLAIIYTVVFSALHFSIMCSRENISFRESLKRSPESAVSFGIGVLVVWPVMALMGYHLRVSRIRRVIRLLTLTLFCDRQPADVP